MTARVLAVSEADSGRPLVELVSDRAAQKGTGRWAVQAALELGVPVPTIAAAVDARTVSADARARQRTADVLHGPRSAAPGIGTTASAPTLSLISVYRHISPGHHGSTVPVHS